MVVKRGSDSQPSLQSPDFLDDLAEPQTAHLTKLPLRYPILNLPLVLAAPARQEIAGSAFGVGELQQSFIRALTSLQSSFPCLSKVLLLLRLRHHPNRAVEMKPLR